MLAQFKEFLKSSNAIALAVGVIIGAASGKLVSSIVDNVLMPIVSLIMPTGDWKEATFTLATKKLPDAKGAIVDTPIILKYGAVLGALVDFLIIMFVMFYIVKLVVRPEAPAATKVCPFCGETIPETATRCRACTSELKA